MKYAKPRSSKAQLPRSLYDSLPYLYACIGVGLLFGLGSGIAFVMGFVLLIAAGLVVYMRSSARDRKYRMMQRRQQRDRW